jgi:PKD repeat protein
MRRRILFLVIFLFSGLINFAQNPKDISRIFSKSHSQNQRAIEYAQEAVTLDLNPDILQQVYNEDANQINITIPISENENVTLDLRKFKILNDNFILRTSGGDTLKDYKPGLFYRGKIVGKEGIVTLSIFSNEIIGILSIKEEGNYNIGKIKGTQNQYVVYNDFKVKVPRSFECHTPDTPLDFDPRKTDNSVSVRVEDCVKFYLEGDYELFQDKGSVAAASNYMTALFAEVAELYANESISIEISDIMVWNTPDNYTNSDSGTDLDIFIDNNPNFNGNLAALMSLGGGSAGLGGLAYVDVLCSQNWAYSFNGIGGGFNNVPAYSWDVEVCAHEWGHNFGSRHTHACVWNGNNTQIDDCGNKYSFDNGDTPEGDNCFNPNNPILPDDGTIMSYCHLIWGVGINFNLGFGTQPGNLIRNRYNNAGCLTACNGGGGQTPEAEFSAEPQVVCEGDVVIFNDLSTNNPNSWQWTFLGGDPISSTDQNPEITYYEAGVYDVTLVASNGAGPNTLTKNDYVTVNKVAEPSFTYNIVNYFQVQFTSQSQFASDYYWEFGDGTTSNLENPVHTYDVDGNYTVTLFASNSNCTAYQGFVQYIEIISPPVAGFTFTQTDFCKPSTIQFFNASSSNVTSRQWFFEGGYPATSTAINPVVQYNETGIFNVKLTVSNELYTNTKELTDTVKIYTTPLADFTYSINGNIVTFTNTTQNGASYLWNFGDNTTSTVVNPVHTYQNGGTYNVLLTANNQCGPGSINKSITISTEAQAEFSVDVVSGCAPFSTTFHNLSNTNTISWVFEGGVPATSTQLNPVVNYMNPGLFKVTLYATNSLGTDTLVRDDYIEVLALPSGAFTNTISGYTANFSQATNNTLGFYWKFGDGSQSTLFNPSHTYQNDGTYLVEFVYFNNCDTLIYTKNVAIANPPVANFTYSASTGCKPLTVTFTNTSSTNANSFLWTFEGGTPGSSSLINPVVTFQNKGTFNVSLTATNGLGSNTKLENDLITVLSTPLPNFTHTKTGLNYSFTYSGETANQVKWLFGDGGSAIGQQVSHTYISVGTYLLKVIATNNCGSDTLEYSLIVALKPTANFTYNVNQGCAPLEVQFQNTSSSANSIFWTFEGGIPSFSTSNNPVVTYTLGGEYDVQLIAYSSTGNDTLYQESLISVDGGPLVNFNYSINGPTVNFTSLCSAEANEFFWDFGDGIISEEKNPVHTYTSNGNYSVTLFANNTCGQQSKSKNVLMSTVKTDDLSLNKMVLYPNPNSGEFSIEFDSPEEGNYSFRVYNSTGMVVADRNIALEAGSNKTDFLLSDLPQGLYLLKISKDARSYQILFSKQ